MKVIRPREIHGTEREVHCPKGGFVSFRYLLERDGMGFGLHETRIPKGDRQFWHYKHHREACYCVSGEGFLRNEQTGEQFAIYPGVCYVLDNYDDHSFMAVSNVVLISVFNPPVTGTEVHAADGSYAKAGAQ
jgi:L-ectoine synthase